MGRMQTDVMLRQAQSALEANHLSQARTICDQLMQLDSRNVSALNLLGQIAFARSSYDEAAGYLDRSVAIRPRDPRAHLILGELRTIQGQYKAAIARYDTVLRLQPGAPWAIAGKADAWEKSGERRKARALLEPFITAGRETPLMAIIQTRLELHNRAYEVAVNLVSRHSDTSGTTAWHLFSLLGKALEKLGRFDEAFAAYRRSNEAVPSPFNESAWLQHTQDLIGAFTAERMAKLPRAAHGSRLPIFIIGMPRCGSTLVETILDAHPEAHGAGEFAAMQELVNEITLRIGSLSPYPACIEDLAQTDVDDLAGTYLDRLGAVNPQARRLADKYLINYRHLGLIELLVPDARVIHCLRDPLDTCISCYAQPLFPAAHPYAGDLRRLGVVYCDYQRLMTHWRSVLKIPILQVQYEKLVRHQERVTRQILDFCGLDWDERCLRFYDRERVVQTASYDQVTRPIYHGSVGRAKAFEKHLRPLQDELVKGGVTDHG